MRNTTRILYVVLVINAVVMVAGLLLGPDTAGSALFVISIGLAAHVAHWGTRGTGREKLKSQSPDVVELPDGGPHRKERGNPLPASDMAG